MYNSIQHKIEDAKQITVRLKEHFDNPKPSSIYWWTDLNVLYRQLNTVMNSGIEDAGTTPVK